jgi:hypothetical protein
MMKNSKFVSLSKLASKATGGAYGSSGASLPPSHTSGLSTPTNTNGSIHHAPGPHTPGRERDLATMERKRITWADRVREKLPPLDPNEYEVLWERGVLGVIFLESEKDGIPYVSKATESCISPMVAPGDILKFVNDVRSEKHTFSEFFKILATMKKPVLLRFERPSNPRIDGGGAEIAASANDVSSSRAAAMKDAAKAFAAKVQRSNSVPPPQFDKQQSSPSSKPAASSRGAFWRSSTAKELAPAPTPTKTQAKSTPATPKTPRRRDMQSPVAKHKYDGDTDTSDSPTEPWEDDERIRNGEVQLIEVYWETGSLGLFFGEEKGTGYPVVTRSTPGVNPTVHRTVQTNDVLLAANGVRSADFKFEAFFARLQQMSKPVKLVFRRKVEAPGTPPPLTRKTSLPKEMPASVASLQPKLATIESMPPSPLTTRPTRLPPPKQSSENAAVVDIRHTVTNASPAEQSNGYDRQEPASASKPRSTSVETRTLLADEHQSPIKSAVGNIRIKSPSTRPDIVSLGSPPRKASPRVPPPSQVAPKVVAESSPRGKGDKAPRSPTNSQVTSAQPSSPSAKRSPQQNRPDKSKQDATVLSGDAGVSSRETSQATEALKAAEIKQDVIEVETAVVATAVVQVVEDSVAVGVPLEAPPVAKDTSRAESVAVVDDTVAAVVVEEPVSLSPKKEVDVPAPVAPSDEDVGVEVGLPVPDLTSEAPSVDEMEKEDLDDTNSQTSTESDSDEGEALDAMVVQDDPDITGDLASNDMITSNPKGRGSSASPVKPNKAALNASLAKYRKKSKNSRPLVKLPAISEDNSQTVPLTAPNAVNTSVQVRGRSKPKPSLLETPDSQTYLVKWKEGRSVGLQLREVRLAKGTFPLVVDVCKEPCCDVLKHVSIGDVIVEINGRNCSTMGVKKTVTFLKTSSKTMLLKLRRGPGFLNDRVSAYA